MEACADCGFVVQLWHNVVGLYDYTLLLEYCPYGTLQTMLNVSWGQGGGPPDRGTEREVHDEWDE